MSRTASFLRFLPVLLVAGTVLADARVACAAEPTPAPTAHFKRPKPVPRTSDGMVRVPAGKFFMGCNEQADEDCLDDEKPGKFVELPAFEIDATEVTVAQFGACVQAKACSAAGLNMPFVDGKDDPKMAPYCNWQKKNRQQHPINCVDWTQALAYCRWAGKRLPTEAEWERAARGTDGRIYVWGNETERGIKFTNIADESARKVFPEWKHTGRYDDGFVGTAPAGSFPDGVSPAGALDMIGNVWEWTGDSREAGHSVRGASWTFEPAWVRVSLRGWTKDATRAADGGFRCAR
ncbi:formylglycine-generating enzyme family protein [Candidatus Binatia bacterium]|nr:formylglycine-generating enzyme family protein [Candidatus Binatia bacterium]